MAYDQGLPQDRFYLDHIPWHAQDPLMMTITIDGRKLTREEVWRERGLEAGFRFSLEVPRAPVDQRSPPPESPGMTQNPVQSHHNGTLVANSEAPTPHWKL